MVTVINYGKSGNLIPDLSKVTINLEQWPALAAELQRITDAASAMKASA